MDPKLESIIKLQDLDLMIAEVTDAKASKKLNEMGFSMENLDRLKDARAELAKQLDNRMLRHYERLGKRYSHRVVPVSDNVCLGCFMTQPTQFSDQVNQEIRTCQSCNRILYSL